MRPITTRPVEGLLGLGEVGAAQLGEVAGEGHDDAIFGLGVDRPAAVELHVRGVGDEGDLVLGAELPQEMSGRDLRIDP